MRRWLTVILLAGGVLLCNGLAQAQTANDDANDTRRDDRASLAIGVGLVKPAGSVENYWTAALRIPVGHHDGDSGRDDSRARRERQGGISGFLEPEVGYWKSTDRVISGRDLLAGVNLIGVVPMGVVDSFFGVGAGIHSIDKELLLDDPRATGSATKVGADAQFGIDVHLGRSVSAFGTGRFDLVQGSKSDVQSKVYLGLRFFF
jgi:hypothetical protein